ncbi:heterokaryon incompatibility protein-domain-containing protein, partial [Pseudoneurospora amorphoporcata]
MYHSNYRKPGDYIPTRLLSLSTPSKGLGSHVYLQLASELGDFIPFSALSYCWGGDQQLKLEKSLIERLRTTDMGIEELPPIIADAVTVTLSLGIRHLWVDALCILQDSDEDKAREIGFMGKIYSAATVTLA